MVDALEATEQFTKQPVWALIDLDAAAYNMQQLRKIVGPDTLITAIVKANAYGHGAVEMAKVFLKNGADRLAVSSVSEAVELRLAGITERIFILGRTDGRRAREVVLYGLDVAVFHYDDAVLFSEEAQRQNQVVNLHIAADTGMGRIGYRPCEESIAEIKRIAALPHVAIEGLFTHFAVADMSSDESVQYTKKQYEIFSWFCRRLKEEGVDVHVHHCCNSAGTIEYKDFHYDMVRPGIIQYGCNPSDEVVSHSFTPRPVMSLHCCVMHLKTIEPGDTVSYGRHFTATKPTVIATLPIGYADGYPRLLSNRAEVLIHGRRAPQVGNICMDQCMIDVTDIPDVQVGDEVVLFGKQGDETIPVEEIAGMVGTIDHEILCNINRRVPRIYVQGGKIVKRIEYLFD